MKFTDIEKDAKVFPGEYILHTPTQQVVLCGSFNRSKNSIRVLARGKVFEDRIHNFKKIIKEPKDKTRRSCGGCKQ